MISLNLEHCDHERRKKSGKDHLGQQRYKCHDCGKRFIDKDSRPLGHMRTDLDTAASVLHHLLEGTSINATCRLLGIAKNTVLELLHVAAARCQAVWDRYMTSLQVESLQADEMWGFVRMKEKTRERLNAPECFGDVYAFTCIESTSKLIVAFHIDKRTSEATVKFLQKIDAAIVGKCQLNTDGFGPYLWAVPKYLGNKVDHATIVKLYASPTQQEQRKYSPARIAGTIRKANHGSPDMGTAGTSFVERHNRTIRMQVRRLTRLVDAHSKLWANHEAMLTIFFCWYNFARKHLSLKGKTPAQAHGLTDHRWTIRELLEKGSAC